MPLQGDQRALLQLLCERGQNYEDIAGLLGGTPDDVRERARAALAEMGGADPDAEVGLTDYLLGQADPIGRADAVRHLQSDPEALDLAGRIEASLRLVAPDANLPKLPEPRGKRRRAAVPAAGDETSGPARTGDPGRVEALSSRSGGEGGGGNDRQTAIYSALAGAAVILLVVVLAIAGVFSGDEGSEEGSSPVAEASGETDSTTATTPDAEFGQVKLVATGNSGVAGEAKFGIVDGTQPYVDVAVNGLDPQAGRKTTHLLWLMIGETGGFPIPTPLTPDENGRFSGRLAIPTPAVAIAQEADTLRLSLSPLTELGEEVRNAAREGLPVVPFTGTELAQGKIPAARPASG